MTLRSTETARGLERVTHQALYKSMGYPVEDLGKPMIGTANTMGCVAEAPGMMLPGTAVIPSVGPH